MRLPRVISQPLFFLVGVITIFPPLMTSALAARVPTSNADSHSSTEERLTSSPAQLQFGEVTLGQTKNAFVTITNRGGSSLTVSAATSTRAEFSLSGLDLPLSLSAGESYTFTVTFAPQARGVADGSISVVSGASKKTLTMRLAGTAAENTPAHETTTGNMPRLVQHKVKLSWKASTSKHVIGYNIYRANRARGPYKRINRTLDPYTYFTDRTVAVGHKYYYVATAVNRRKTESVHSKHIEVVIPLSYQAGISGSNLRGD